MTQAEAKPVILYVDDEPNNLTVFEASLPETWDIQTCDNPVSALNRLEELKPWVVVSDQRMPVMKGVDFLDLTRKLAPQAVRMIVTGFSEEDLIIESVRKAQVFDYIRKPWDVTDLTTSLQRAIDFHRINAERESLLTELKHKTEKLTSTLHELETSSRRERDMAEELKSWVPPFVLWALSNPNVHFPVRKRLVGITFDIVGSSRIHEITVNNKPLRARVIELFSEAIMRNSGWRESHSGDSAYAHFGLQDDLVDPYESALAAAREFRVGLRSLAQISNVEIECGIALHVAEDAVVDVHKVQLNTAKGIVTQKSFDTTSSEIDLLHRIEKLVHDLPGSNIIMTEAFALSLKKLPDRILSLGAFIIRGQKIPTRLFLLASDLVKNSDVEKFKDKFASDTSAVKLDDAA